MVDNVKIYNLCESIVASGLPMQPTYDMLNFKAEVESLKTCFKDFSMWDVVDYDQIKDNKHYKRACKLASNPSSSGHCNFLTGIVVSMNITAPVKWWEQWQRYHFQQIVSSQSTMHRLRAMLDSDSPFTFDEVVSPDQIEWLKNNASELTDEELAYNCPMGLRLTAHVVTNYMQLRNMYQQRKHHKLQAWKEFCDFIDLFPLAKELITLEDKVC
jgi:hypothetical protein